MHAGEGQRVGNVEFLARSVDTDRFNLAIVTIEPARLVNVDAPAGFDRRIGG